MKFYLKNGLCGTFYCVCQSNAKASAVIRTAEAWVFFSEKGRWRSADGLADAGGDVFHRAEAVDDLLLALGGVVLGHGQGLVIVLL